MKTEPTINIQSEVVKIHSQFGMTEIANYRIEKLFEMYVKQSSPKIKQLEWIGSEGGNVLTGIAIYDGYYRITSTSEGAWMRIATAGIRKMFDTVDEAKEAAQSDFEKRIKECLDL